MTVVVSDTSPLNYLVQIKCAQLLPALYEHILIPSMVLRELENAGTPAIMRTWLSRLPEWIVVREVHTFADPGLDGLDAGRRAPCDSTGQGRKCRPLLVGRTRRRARGSRARLDRDR